MIAATRCRFAVQVIQNFPSFQKNWCSTPTGQPSCVPHISTHSRASVSSSSISASLKGKIETTSWSFITSGSGISVTLAGLFVEGAVALRRLAMIPAHTRPRPRTPL